MEVGFFYIDISIHTHTCTERKRAVEDEDEDEKEGWKEVEVGTDIRGHTEFLTSPGSL